MSHIENRRAWVIVDSDDFLAIAHTGLMLNSAAYADGDIQTRPNRCAGLTNLMVAVDKAQVNGSSCCAGRCAECIG